jgi:hypothetical protein
MCVVRTGNAKIYFEEEGAVFKGTVAKNFAFNCLLVGLLDFSSTLKMEALCSSETSVATQRTTRRHIPPL